MYRTLIKAKKQDQATFPEVYTKTGSEIQVQKPVPKARDIGTGESVETILTDIPNPSSKLFNWSVKISKLIGLLDSLFHKYLKMMVR